VRCKPSTPSVVTTDPAFSVALSLLQPDLVQRGRGGSPVVILILKRRPSQKWETVSLSFNRRCHVALVQSGLRARKKIGLGSAPGSGANEAHVPWQLNLRGTRDSGRVAGRFRSKALAAPSSSSPAAPSSSSLAPLQALRWRPLQALLMSGADCLESVGCFVRTTSQLFVTAGPAGQKS